MSPEEDPRKELVDQLIEHERFKNAAEMLQQKRVVEEAVWSNPQIERFIAEGELPGLAVTIFDLVKTLQTVLERAKNRPLYEVGQEDVSVPEMMQFLRDALEPVPARTAFGHAVAGSAAVPASDDLPVPRDSRAGETPGH